MHRHPTRRRLRADRRGLAMLEFAIVAPVMVVMATAGFDITRALVTWQEVDTAAEWAALSAQSLAVNPGTPGSAATTTLTPQQAVVAMTTIYASMPQVFSGLWGGKYAIVMSGVQWYTVNGTPQPFIVWTTTLQQLASAEVWPKTWDATFFRKCTGAPEPQVVTVPNDVSVLQSVPTQNITDSSTFLVVDIHYQFQPVLPGLSYITGPVDFYTSFSWPSLIGSNNQPLTYNGGYPAAGNCVTPS
jgi:hypothetical protein